MPNSIIEVNDISKKFKNKEVITNIKCSFEAGKIYGLIGDNGCGKTVLLKMLSGFMTPSSGSIIVNGKQIGKDIDFPRNIGVLIETPGFLPNFTGYKNLLFLTQIRRLLKKEQIFGVMESVGLNPKLKTKVSKYSLGMLQRLAFAQAVMENQSILILDEIFSSLDQKGIELIKKLLLVLKSENKVAIITSHNKNIISELCDEVYRIENGNLIIEK